ncbi:MAG: TRAM domain-containing protein [Phycisphaera sp.]|nr:TRAM domain-containing protein [Phycisphaera sp.]
MVLNLLRGLFVMMSAAVAALYAVGLAESQPERFGQKHVFLFIIGAIAVSTLIVAIDVFTTKKKLVALSGVFLGLIVGMIAAYAVSFLVDFVHTVFPDIPDHLLEGIKVLIGVVCVFVSISMVIQTKDDFRFVIPYVELSKQIRGTRPMLLDTSAIIDGRILDIATTHILQGLLIIPKFVLDELQTISDSADKLKRARGRRGLDILGKLQSNPTVDVSIEDAEAEGATVDQKLVSLAQDLHARIITTDFNLTKVAEVRGVEVINVNILAEALRPVVLPGEQLSVKIVKPGESPSQGVGYLEDGTMVVVEKAREMIGRDVALTVTSVLQTSAGRMMFGRLNEPRKGGVEASDSDPGVTPPSNEPGQGRVMAKAKPKPSSDADPTTVETN